MVTLNGVGTFLAFDSLPKGCGVDVILRIYVKCNTFRVLKWR
jgi:hypothetical protein